jgi:YD repeat-containing protein
MLTAQVNTYQTNGSAVPRTALLTRTDNYAWGEGDFRQTYATFAYDAYGNVTQTIQAGDASQTGDEVETDTTFTYNTSAYLVGLPSQVQQKIPGGALLTQATYGYDASPPARGDLLSLSRLLRYPGAADDTATRTMTYWTNGTPKSTTDETGRVVNIANETGTGYSLFPQSVTNGANEVTSRTWDVGCAAVLTETDPNNRVTTNTYDPLCRQTRTDLPLGGYVVRSQPDLGDPGVQRVRTETPPPPGVTGVLWSEAYFDGLGRNWQTVSRGPASGQDIVVEQRYGSSGRLIESVEPRYVGEAERVTQYAYDALGRVFYTALPGGRETSTLYEATSRIDTDPDGKQATSRFDAYGRVIELERSLDSQPVLTQTQYDVLGRRIGMTDPAGIAWTWAYDSLGRVRQETDPDAGNSTFTYDKAGRPLTKLDAKGQTTTFAYDTPVGRLQTKTNAAGTVTFTYSQARTGFYNKGRLTRVSMTGNSLDLDYDALGRNVKQKRTISAVNYTLTKSLDPSGYQISTTYPDGDVVGGLTYDGAGRLASIPGIVTAISYDALGRPLSRQNANTTTTTWSYADARGFLTGIDTSGAQGTVQDLDYSNYTNAGLLGQVTSPISGEGWSYAYDDLGHMIEATHSQSPADSQSFTYDGADRILTSSRYGNYSYPTATQAHPHSPNSVNGTPLIYDLNGNVTQAGTKRDPGRHEELDLERQRPPNPGDTRQPHDHLHLRRLRRAHQEELLARHEHLPLRRRLRDHGWRHDEAHLGRRPGSDRQARGHGRLGHDLLAPHRPARLDPGGHLERSRRHGRLAPDVPPLRRDAQPERERRRVPRLDRPEERSRDRADVPPCQILRSTTRRLPVAGPERSRGRAQPVRLRLGKPCQHDRPQRIGRHVGGLR